MNIAAKVMRLFEGYKGAYGTHGATERSISKGGKLEIRKTAKTVREEVTTELWALHLSGTAPLGIIPIREDNCCLWCCIDVDDYTINHAAVVQKLEAMNLPLVVCKTKSGGAHVFMFLAEPVPADQLRAKMREVAAALGWGNCEIFPKQNEVLLERGDLGCWLNMPYLGGDKTERYAVKKTGVGMSLEEFLSYVEKRKVKRSELANIKLPQLESEGLEDGPPCLQHLAAVGFPDGSRNNGLFGLAVFAKKKFGNRWKEILERYNRDFMIPPLDSSEVQEVIKSAEKTDYGYMCSDQPCVAYCNSMLCRTRKYGIGGAGDIPLISGISKLDTDDPLWFVDVENTRLELTTPQLQNYREFHRVCMERLTVCYSMIKMDTWMKMLSVAMENAHIINAPPELSAMGQFTELLEDFCISKHRGERPEDLFLGKPWYDDKENRYYFRLRDLMKHLDVNNFRTWGRNKVGQRIQELNGGKHFFNVQGSGVNVYWVPGDFQGVPEIELPPTTKQTAI